jgi:pilus assembly protein CpaE
LKRQQLVKALTLSLVKGGSKLTNLLIADPDTVFLRRMISLLRGQPNVRIIDVKRILGEVEKLIPALKPQVVILGPNCDVAEVMNFASRISTRYPESVLILIAKEITATLLRQALQVGFRDVLPIPTTSSDLLPSIEMAASFSKRMSETIRQGVAVPAKATFVAVFSGKGGVGKTFVSTNLAISIARYLGTDVVLVDLDLQFGDAGVMLQLSPRQTLYDAIQVIDRLDVEMIRGFLTPHFSGLKVLLAPPRPEMADDITEDQVKRVLQILRDAVHFVVIDTPALFSEYTLLALDFSDIVLIVTTPELPSIKDTKVAIETMRLARCSVEKLRLVLNRSDSEVGISPRDVEEVLGHKVFFELPSDGAVPISINEGIPVVIRAPRSKSARAISRLTKAIVELEEREAA